MPDMQPDTERQKASLDERDRMQRLMIMTFTDRGYEIGNRIKNDLSPEPLREIAVKRIAPGTLDDETSSAWNEGFDLLYIGAIGIAVRATAALIRSKMSDRAVVVMDEEGQCLIPVLSGHAGGADALAYMIAGYTGGRVTVTAASAVRGVKAFDEWAVKNGFAILNKDRIAPVYEKIYADKILKVFTKDYEGEIPFGKYESFDRGAGQEDPGDTEKLPDVIIYGGTDTEFITEISAKYSGYTLLIVSRFLTVGVGCKRGTAADRIMNGIEDACEKNGLDIRLIGRLATIDVKSDEEGIKSVCALNRWKLDIFSAEELKEVQGEFNSSDFVEKTVGVDNVCERAAVRAGGKLLVKKSLFEGVTVAIAASDKRNGNKSPDVKKKIFIVGLGPGAGDGMTIEADRVLRDTDVIVGYKTYLDLVRDRYPGKEYMSTPMKKERERCILAFEEAAKGKAVSMVCSGDSGIYGMASLMYEELASKVNEEYELQVVPGVTAAISGAALLGAPIGHDFCVISLSDLLTPRELIEKRLRAAAESDFNIVLYNPSSVKRSDYLERVKDILIKYMDADRICGITSLIGRKGEKFRLCRLDELGSIGADMFSTVFIGSSTTKIINGHMVTPRGYK